MGSVYMATSELEGKTFVKFGFSSHDDPTERIEGVTSKYRGMGMTHKCHAYYVTEDYKSIEKCLHEQLGEDLRTKDITSRLDSKTRPQIPSQEHYEISIEHALTAFKNAIEEIKGHTVGGPLCPHLECIRFYP